MTDESPAQDREDWASAETAPTTDDAELTDSALLEAALRDAVEAHADGLLAAPFGVDETALYRARLRALQTDLKRLVAGLREDVNRDDCA